jgi:hypothetical protein
LLQRRLTPRTPGRAPRWRRCTRSWAARRTAREGARALTFVRRRQEAGGWSDAQRMKMPR